MSISKELVQVPSEAAPGSGPFIQEKLNLNELIRQALKPFLAGRNHDIIVRCSDLPQVYGDQIIFQEVFNQLVRMIMLHPGSSRKFLHIKCEDQLAGQKSKTLNYSFRIEFYTNLTTDLQWKQLNQEVILDCQEKLLKQNAILSIHEISTAGCLFSISLQGKIF